MVNSDEDGDDYDYEDSYIDLNGKELNYTTGLSVSGDFILGIRIKEYYESGKLLTVSDESYGLTLTSYVYDDAYMRFRLTVPNGLTPYILYSEPYLPTPATVFTIYIKRVNSIYQLYVFTTEAETENDMHFGTNEPDVPSMYDIWINNENEPTETFLKEDVHRFIMEEEPIVLAQNKFDIWIGRWKDSVTHG